jgi:hypothetical protein
MIRILKNCPEVVSTDENIINELISKMTVNDDGSISAGGGENDDDDKKSKKGNEVL